MLRVNLILGYLSNKRSLYCLFSIIGALAFYVFLLTRMNNEKVSLPSRVLLRPFDYANFCQPVTFTDELFKGKGLRERRYFFASILSNSQEALKLWRIELPKLVSLLSNAGHSNIFISIHSSGSDGTYKILRQIRGYLDDKGIPYDITMDGLWDRHKGGQRIERLAFMRNFALRRLFSDSVIYERVIFSNDVFFCAHDVVNMLHISFATDADITCGMDYNLNALRKPAFYDKWVATDINGYKFANDYPFLRTSASVEAFKAGNPFQVVSCWNGIVSIQADIFQSLRYRFRTKRDTVECSLSECEYICRDMVSIGRNKIAVVPSLQLAYKLEDFQIVKEELFLSASHIADPATLIWKPLPDLLECCGIKPNFHTLNFQECFLEPPTMAYKLLGLPWNESTQSRLPKSDSILDLYEFFRSKYHCSANSSSHRKIPYNFVNLIPNKTYKSLSYIRLRSIMSWWEHYPCYEFKLLTNEQEAYDIVRSFLGISTPDLSRLRENNALHYLSNLITIYQIGGISAGGKSMALATIDNLIRPGDTLLVIEEASVRKEIAALYGRTGTVSFDCFASTQKNPVIKTAIKAVLRQLHRIQEANNKDIFIPPTLQSIIHPLAAVFSDAAGQAEAQHKVHVRQPIMGSLHKNDLQPVERAIIPYGSVDLVRVTTHPYESPYLTEKRLVSLQRRHFLHYLERLLLGTWVEAYPGDLSMHTPLWSYSFVSTSTQMKQLVVLIVLKGGFKICHAESYATFYSDCSVIFEFKAPPLNPLLKHFALTLQDDGNLVFSAMSQEELDYLPIRVPAAPLWFSGPITNAERCLFTILRKDGSLATYRGRNPTSVDKSCKAQ